MAENITRRDFLKRAFIGLGLFFCSAIDGPQQSYYFVKDYKTIDEALDDFNLVSTVYRENLPSTSLDFLIQKYDKGYRTLAYSNKEIPSYKGFATKETKSISLKDAKMQENCFYIQFSFNYDLNNTSRNIESLKNLGYDATVHFGDGVRLLVGPYKTIKSAVKQAEDLLKNVDVKELGIVSPKYDNGTDFKWRGIVK